MMVHLKDVSALHAPQHEAQQPRHRSGRLCSGFPVEPLNTFNTKHFTDTALLRTHSNPVQLVPRQELSVCPFLLFTAYVLCLLRLNKGAKGYSASSHVPGVCL